ncbi:hypothetical protein [Streptomyces sp. NPDC001137]|uniref:hypothetical protein n=1 Tax=Streptomyces sp. NPDC001137 TaxID=3154378 RepID=UPI0033206BC3
MTSETLTDVIRRAESALTYTEGDDEDEPFRLSDIPDRMVADSVLRNPESAREVCYVAALLNSLNHRDDALRLIRTAATALSSPRTSRTPEWGAALNQLGVMAASLGDVKSAYNVLRRLSEECPPVTPSLRARIDANLAAVEVQLGMVEQARASMRRSHGYLGATGASAGAEDPSIRNILAAVELAVADHGTGKASQEAAVAHFRTVNQFSLEDLDAETGNESREISLLVSRAVVELAQARAKHDTHELDRLVLVLETITARAASSLGSDHPQTVTAMVNLACAEFEAARIAAHPHSPRFDRAVEALRSAVEMATRRLGPEHHLVATASATHARALREVSRTTRQHQPTQGDETMETTPEERRPRATPRPVRVPNVLRKALVTSVVAAGTYLITNAMAAKQSQLWQLAVSVLIGGSALIIQYLIDFGERLDTMEEAVSARSRELADVVEMSFARVNEATQLFSQVDSSVLRSDGVAQLARSVTQLGVDSPDIVRDFATEEIDRLATLMGNLNSRIADYEGENLDWLLSLTQCAKKTIDAVSTSATRDLWFGPHAPSYLETESDAVQERGVKIRRLFIVQRPEDVDDSLERLCEDQRGLGIEARVLVPSQLPLYVRRGVIKDFILFDQSLSYEVEQDFAGLGGRTTLNVRSDDIASRVRRFDLLWESAEARTDDHTHGTNRY